MDKYIYGNPGTEESFLFKFSFMDAATTHEICRFSDVILKLEKFFFFFVRTSKDAVKLLFHRAQQSKITPTIKQQNPHVWGASSSEACLLSYSLNDVQDESIIKVVIVHFSVDFPLI